MFIEPLALLSAGLGIVVCILLAAFIVRWFLKVDSVVDDRQVVYSKFAGLLERVQFLKSSDAAHHVAALSIKKAYHKIRALVDSLSTEEELMIALRPNFFWQTPKRLANTIDRAELLKAVVNTPEARAELIVLLAEQKAAA